MPRYVAIVETPLSPALAWAKMADVAAFPTWDPGVLAASQVVGDGLAKAGLLASDDRILVDATPAGARVTYDATLRLRGPLRALHAALVPVFLRVGRRAEAGLRRHLGSER